MKKPTKQFRQPGRDRVIGGGDGAEAMKAMLLRMGATVEEAKAAAEGCRQSYQKMAAQIAREDQCQATPNHAPFDGTQENSIRNETEAQESKKGS